MTSLQGLCSTADNAIIPSTRLLRCARNDFLSNSGGDLSASLRSGRDDKKLSPLPC